ncbi:MAG: hypothetical protein ACI9OJ_000889 [Myxococcota bacterium]|jgi:hypothetical protein
MTFPTACSPSAVWSVVTNLRPLADLLVPNSSRLLLSSTALIIAVFSASSVHAQELQFDWKAYIESEIRLAFDIPFDDEKSPQSTEFERFESTLGGEIKGRYGDFILGKAHLEITYTELGNVATFNDLTDRSALDPLRFESDALFVEFTNTGLDGLDIAIGRRQEIWGTGARFNPVSNINPLDVGDPLRFGDTLATEMISVRYSPYVFGGDEDDPWFEEFSIQLVVVPYFKPAQLPGSSSIAFTDVDEQFRRATTPALKSMVTQQRGYIEAGADVRYNVAVERPDVAIENTQVAARMAFKLGGIDMGFSYYRGFDDFPRAESATVTGDSSDVTTDIVLSYPRMQVFGVDMAASVPFLGGLGVWAEVALHLHDDQHIIIDGTEFVGNQGSELFPNGPEREYEEGLFVKAVAGIDYTPISWWYFNIQYLYGFIDEFGADNLGHYLVVANDFYVWNKRITLRLAGIMSFGRPEDTALLRDEESASGVLFPQIIIKPFAGGEFSVGAFLYLGKSNTKFGSPVAGASTVFTKARITF